MSNFDPNAILRGAQLTLVGAHRALQNPALFTSDHYRQAAVAVLAGIVIRLIVSFPVIGVRVALWFLSIFMDMDGVTWDNELIDGLHFIENSVLQAPLFLMSLLRLVSPTLDNLFMESLDWVDRTYIQKHKSDDPNSLRAMYYPNLRLYSSHREGQRKTPREAGLVFIQRHVRKAAISLAVYLLTFLPYIGRFVLPAASFYTFNKAVGPQPAIVIFGGSILLPKRYLVVFLQSYFSSRGLMRELLVPYFSRVHYNKDQKKRWFRDREGVLFGFGVGFFLLLKIPLVGVLIYGIAEASTAYLITKVTDPPPPPSEAAEYIESNIRWKNKHEFLNLPLANLDANNVRTEDNQKVLREASIPRKQYT